MPPAKTVRRKIPSEPLKARVHAEGSRASEKTSLDQGDIAVLPFRPSAVAPAEPATVGATSIPLPSVPIQTPSPSRRMQRFVYVRDLFITLVGRDLKLRYKRSVLGIAWSLLTPLAQLAVFFLIFGVLLLTSVPNYLSYLFSGVLVWNWFQGSLYNATSAIVENRELIRRPGFPIAVLPAVTVASYLIHFLLALPILFGFMVFDGIPMTSTLLALPLVIAVQFVLTLSLAYFTATFFVTFRDTQHLLNVVLNLLLFLSPIFYKTTDLPLEYQSYYRWNPLVHLIEAYRGILMDGAIPDPGALLLLSGSAVGLLVLGYTFFRRASYRFVDEL